MPFETEVEYSGIANTEQTDLFFSDTQPVPGGPNNFDIRQFPPVYSRTPYVVTPVFRLYRNAIQTNDPIFYKITRVKVENSQGSANGVVINTDDYLPWSNSNVLTSSDELILESSTGQGTYIIDNFRVTNLTANGESQMRIDIREQSSPMTDTWNYVNLDYSNGQVLSSDDLPQANTYGGLYKWQEPVPDIIEETFTFTVYATLREINSEGSLYLFEQTWDVDMNVYFDYAPVISILPTVVSQGRF